MQGETPSCQMGGGFLKCGDKDLSNLQSCRIAISSWRRNKSFSWTRCAEVIHRNGPAELLLGKQLAVPQPNYKWDQNWMFEEDWKDLENLKINLLGEVGITCVNTSLYSGTSQPESWKAPTLGSWNNKYTPTQIISTLYLSVEEQVGMLIKSFWVRKEWRETEDSPIPLLSSQEAEPVQGQEGRSSSLVL